MISAARRPARATCSEENSATSSGVEYMARVYGSYSPNGVGRSRDLDLDTW